MNKLFVFTFLISISLAGHTADYWPKSEDRLKGLADKSNFIMNSGVVFENPKSKKLAIVKSTNIDKFLVANDSHNDTTKKTDSGFGSLFSTLGMLAVAVTNPTLAPKIAGDMKELSKIKPITEDTKKASSEALSSERLVSSLVGIFKNNFGNVSIANDIPSAIDTDADYIVILDMVLGFDNKMEGNVFFNTLGLTDGFINTHSMKLSGLFFDKKLNIIDDISVEEKDSFTFKSEDSNEAIRILETTTELKVREKSLARFNEAVSSKVK